MSDEPQPKTKAAKPRLGRGFDSLLPQDFDASLLLDDSDKIQKVALDKLSPNRQQPRSSFDTEALEQLAQSIKRYGILQPLVVTGGGKGGHYDIIAGERRWRAARLAGLEKVPVIIRSSRELEQLEIALIENVQRVDLSPLEQAVSIERLHQQFSLGYDAIAARLGKAVSTVNNIVRLLRLPADARDALQTGRITEGHARAILALKGQTAAQSELLTLIISRGWSVRQAERFVTGLKAGVREAEQARARADTETPETKALSRHLGTSVHIRRMAHGGKLELGFASDEELEWLLTTLGTIKRPRRAATRR